MLNLHTIPYSLKSLVAPVSTLVIILGALNTAGMLGHISQEAAVQARPVAMGIAAGAGLKEEAVFFDAKTKDLQFARDCFPVHIKTTDRVNTLYLFCSKQAYLHDERPLEVSEFKVPTSLARRFHFWRRVYSLWSHDQYVLHLNPYPEVVLEIADATTLENKSSKVRKKAAYRVLKEKRRQYQILFRRLHKSRGQHISQLTPEARRIVQSMQHISDPNKYQKAAASIRIQRGQREEIARAMSTATRYLPALEQAFKEEGVPPVLAQLAFIESSFNLKAYSKVGAAGIYQIMPATGRQYLRVTNDIDERMEPVKAAHAAAKLLKLYYKLTEQRWPLAITAYNHGVGGINRAVRTTGSRDIAHLIHNYEGRAFGFASKNFYTSFLGLLATVADAKMIFPDIQQQQPHTFTEIKLQRATPLSKVMHKHRLSVATLREYNPDLRYHFVKRRGVLPRNYRLKVPATPDKKAAEVLSDES